MTLASKITIARICLVPVFVVLAFRYGATFDAGQPEPALRWWAVAVFIIAALSDGLDGWVARRFNQRSQLGAFLDPLADKLLMGWGVLVGTLVDWGEAGWHLPMWFAIVVWSRDALMIIGLLVLRQAKRKIEFKPHIAGKLSTATQFIALAWVTLGLIKIDPAWPCAVAAFFTIWSAIAYFRQARALLR
ncbi:MAG: CDP-alcohol phosphatidyltransferase family protein [Akkermansiaceae bacterium]|nr:CDP-alcohol phosphatidyltransferase family protein [Akkermansiaceae bacterium]